MPVDPRDKPEDDGAEKVPLSTICGGCAASPQATGEAFLDNSQGGFPQRGDE
jgi:hypothetical protein